MCYICSLYFHKKNPLHESNKKSELEAFIFLNIFIVKIYENFNYDIPLQYGIILKNIHIF